MFWKSKSEIMPFILHLVTVVIWSHIQGPIFAPQQISGAVEQVLQPCSDICFQGFIVVLQLAPLFLLLLDDTVEQPQTLSQSRVQQLHLLFCTGLFCL